MTKEEQLKIYAAYLPYGLKINDPNSPSERELTYKGYWYRSSEDDTVFISMDEVLECGNKPILYPLEFLTKEIEHEGKRFVPIVEILRKTSLLDLSECKFDVWEDEEKFTTVVYVNAENQNGRVIDSMYYDSNVFWHMNNDGSFNPTNPQREPQEMLLAYGFNVFNLTEDQFINKATLTNK